MPAPTRSVFDFPVPAFMRTAAGSLKPDQAPTFAGFSVPAFMRTVVVVTGDF